MNRLEGGRPRIEIEGGNARIAEMLKRGWSTKRITERLREAGESISAKTVQRRYAEIVCLLARGGYEDAEIAAELRRPLRQISRIIAREGVERPLLRWHDECSTFYRAGSSCPVCGKS